ncbi:hypothetical protein LINPERHAP2_LOCUS41980 [Linum perenne]
MRTVVVLSLLL